MLQALEIGGFPEPPSHGGRRRFGSLLSLEVAASWKAPPPRRSCLQASQLRTLRGRSNPNSCLPLGTERPGSLPTLGRVRLLEAWPRGQAGLQTPFY